MARFQISTEAQTYVNELVSCIHDGLYRTDLESLSLIDMKVVWYYAEGSHDRQVQARGFIAAVEAVMADTFKPPDGDVIRALLALGRFGSFKLTDRTAFIRESLGLRSWDEFRDQGRHRELHKLVVALERQGARYWERQHEDDYLPYLADEDAYQELLPYRLRDYYVSYVYPPTHTGLREIIEVREVVAMRRATNWQGTLEYVDSLEENPKVRFYGDGEFTATVAPLDREGRVRQDLQVTFPRPLEPGESTRFILRKAVPLADPGEYQAVGDLNQVWVNPIVPIERYTVQVRHGGGRRPSRSWHFDKIPAHLRPGDYSEACAIRSTGSALSHTFTHLRRGLAYGVAWEW